jgi:hypothetical protein
VTLAAEIMAVPLVNWIGPGAALCAPAGEGRAV